MLEDFKTVDLDPILSQSSSAKVFYKSVSYGTASTFEYGDGIRNISFPFSLFQVFFGRFFMCNLHFTIASDDVSWLLLCKKIEID